MRLALITSETSANESRQKTKCILFKTICFVLILLESKHTVSFFKGVLMLLLERKTKTLMQCTELYFLMSFFPETNI